MNQPEKTLHERFPIGMVVRCGISVFGNPENSHAVVYENYRLGNHSGISLIFPNGGYDGFSVEDVDLFEVEPVALCEACQDYQFVNVMQLTQDFRNDYFSPAFGKELPKLSPAPSL